MSTNPFEALFAQLERDALIQLRAVWDMLRTLFMDTPDGLLIGIVIGFVSARIVRVVVLAAVLGVCAFFVIRVFGIAIPGIN